MPQASSYARTNQLFHRYRYELSYPLCCEWIGGDFARLLAACSFIQYIFFYPYYFFFSSFMFCKSFPPLLFQKFLLRHYILHLYNIVIPITKFSNICKPEEGWYGQPKYCYEKTIHVVLNQLCSSLWTSRFWFLIFWLIRSLF